MVLKIEPPKPKPTKDPTVQKIENDRAKAEAEAKAKAKAEAEAKAKADAKAKAEAKAKADATSWYTKLLAETTNVANASGRTLPVNIQQVITFMSEAYANYSKPLDQSGNNEAARTRAKQDFIKYKKTFKILSNQFETKYKKSFLDVINTYNKYNPTSNDGGSNPFNPGDLTPAGVAPILPKDLEILKVVLNTDPTVKVLPQTTVDPTIVNPATGDTTNPIGPGGGGASNPITGPGSIIQTTDSNGNVVYNWSTNPSAVNVTFIGDKNGNYISSMVDPDYDRALVEAGLDHKSPMSVDGYFKKITDDLYAQPGAVDRMKNLLIAKHIIRPSAIKLSLAQPGVVDGYMTEALMWAINTTTAYNASLFKLGKPNQKYMGVQDYLNNMNPISVSTTDTQVVHNQVTSKDYELSIDNMFQNTLGRGATAD